MNGNQFDDFYGQLDIENLEWREREKKKIEKEGKRLQRIVLLLTTKKKCFCYIMLYT